METQLLLWIHEQRGPWLDVLFRFSHELGNAPFCTALVVACTLWWLWRRKPREACLWLLVGVAGFLLQLGLKLAFGRLRPALWLGPIQHHSFAFPSGHALIAACLYPLLARAAALRWPGWRQWWYLLAVLLAGYVGVGRLYLGVHWPTDVLAGWVIGAALLWISLRYLPQRRPEPQPLQADTQP